jgi:hypothetical protein
MRQYQQLKMPLTELCNCKLKVVTVVVLPFCAAREAFLRPEEKSALSVTTITLFWELLPLGRPSRHTKKHRCSKPSLQSLLITRTSLL